MLIFLWHQILGQLRSVFWKKNLVVTILSSMMFFYLFLNVLAIGFFVDMIIEKVFPEADLLQKTTQLLLYYFIIDILFRFVLQKLPGITFQYYSLLPIKKSKLLHFPLLGSAISLFNILPALILLIFFFKQVMFLMPWYSSLTWLSLMLLIVFSNNYLNFSLKKRFSKKPILVILILLALTVILVGERFGIIEIGQSWVNLIFLITNSPLLILIPALLLMVTYFFAYYTMSLFYYSSDKMTDKVSKKQGSGLFKSLHRFGTVGRLVEVELKLIMRNKRPRTMMMLSALLGIYIYSGIFNLSATIGEGEASFTSIFITMGFFLFTTGWMMIMYGQLLFAWESNYFDGVLNQKITSFQYISSKYWLLTLQNLISLIFIIPAIFVEIGAFFIGVACLFFNIGVNTYFIIFAGMFNTSKVEPNKSAFMNHQGANIVHFFLVFILLGIPALLFLPFQLLGFPNIGIITIAVLGAAGFFARKIILGKLSDFFTFRKYAMSKGYKDF